MAVCGLKRLMAAVIMTLVTLPVRGDDEKPLSEELPRIPAVEATHAAETIVVQHGFRMNLVAHEPIVADPVDACFDEHGRLRALDATLGGSTG